MKLDLKIRTVTGDGELYIARESLLDVVRQFAEMDNADTDSALSALIYTIANADSSAGRWSFELPRGAARSQGVDPAVNPQTHQVKL